LDGYERRSGDTVGQTLCARNARVIDTRTALCYHRLKDRDPD